MVSIVKKGSEFKKFGKILCSKKKRIFFYGQEDRLKSLLSATRLNYKSHLLNFLLENFEKLYVKNEKQQFVNLLEELRLGGEIKQKGQYGRM